MESRLSTAESLLSTRWPWEFNTWISLNFGSTDSLNQRLTWSGALAKTVLAAGSDRTSAACADAGWG